MSADGATVAWSRVLDELERSIPAAPSLADEPATAVDALWEAPADAEPMPAHLADRARGILALIEERARQIRAVQEEIQRHRGALRESTPAPSRTPLLLDRSA